jgi:hypothetical protein
MVAIADLRPTQMTVGLREVKAKRDEWRQSGDDKQATFLGRHMVPVILGPRERCYVIDHHHLCRALLEAGQTEVEVTVIANLSSLQKEAFWVFMDNRGWLHPYDAEGKRRGWEDLPKQMADMPDDPYRSLAGALRRSGGFAKDTTPFAEFLWADFLRRRIKPARVEKHFDKALDAAMVLAKSGEADFLPGWCGPSD